MHRVTFARESVGFYLKAVASVHHVISLKGII